MCDTLGGGVLGREMMVMCDSLGGGLLGREMEGANDCGAGGLHVGPMVANQRSKAYQLPH